MSRYRVNFIPANAMLMFALGVFIVLNVNRLMTSIKMSTPPTPQRVGELLSTARVAGGYVAPQGQLATGSRIKFDSRSAGGTRSLMNHTWIPLLDRRSGEALLVQFDAKDFDQGSDIVTIQGTLRPIPPAVARRVAGPNAFNAAMRIDRRFVLIPDRGPGSLTTPSVVIAVSTVLLVSMVWLTLNRNVVFMRADGHPFSGGVSHQGPPQPLFVSGTLTFGGKTRRFFTNMPGTITRTDTGNIVFVSLIETSSTVWGLKRVEHSGVWSLSIQAGSISDVQAGDVFWGTQKRRAIRLRFVDGVTGKQGRAVIGSATADPLAMLYG
jgi:hypothetical protein